MTKEQIEKAADDYAYEEWGGGGYECASSDSFIAGAEWRVNSVWHGGGEKPEPGIQVLYEWRNVNGAVVYMAQEFRVYHLRDSNWNCMGIIRWAYIEDLLPGKEARDEE